MDVFHGWMDGWMDGWMEMDVFHSEKTTPDDDFCAGFRADDDDSA